MKKQKMTIHRALVELKLIGSRIEKATNAIKPVGVMRRDGLVGNLINKEVFEADAKSGYQSVIDLLERRNKIKTAIVNANGVTVVKVAGNKMTIADAINYKSIIEYKKELIRVLILQYTSIKAKFLTENEKVEQVALENAKIMLGKKGDDNAKPTDEDVKQIMEPFVKRNELLMVDPLKVDKLIVDLTIEVDNFDAEVDAVLSEINAVTIIEV